MTDPSLSQACEPRFGSQSHFPIDEKIEPQRHKGHKEEGAESKPFVPTIQGVFSCVRFPEPRNARKYRKQAEPQATQQEREPRMNANGRE
jgi:hypothetical protein